jgi:cell division protease FtsH
MSVLLGGRAAEHVVFGHYSTGAADDLAKVTDIARSMVMRYGMDEKLGAVSYDKERATFLQGPRMPVVQEYSEDTARQIDRSVRDIVAAAFERSVAILNGARALLEKSARELLQKETLGEEELKILRGELFAAKERGGREAVGAMRAVTTPGQP